MWPKSDVSSAIRRSLVEKFLGQELGRNLLSKSYGGTTKRSASPAFADLCCYWFEKATRINWSKERCKRAGLTGDASDSRRRKS